MSQGSNAIDDALGLIRALSVEIGPRRPCSAEEAAAAALVERWLRDRGVDARREQFAGYADFAHVYAPMIGAALAGGLLQRRGRRFGDVLTIVSFALAALEADLRATPLSDLVSRRPSANVVGLVPASSGTARRVVCLCGHLDTQRSGLAFHPRVIGFLKRIRELPAVSGALLAAGPLARRLPGGKSLQTGAIAGMAITLALMAERQARGRDVPGANDNASGTAVAAQLAAECAARPLEHTEVRLLLTGCEESGVLGAQAYARRHGREAARTTFVNFDTVGGPEPLTYILREGGPVAFTPAAPRLVAAAEAIARRRPDLGLAAAPGTPGLPTDATPLLARGWEAITFLAQDHGRVANYHWPTDTYENVSRDGVARALEAGREMLSELDRDPR